MQGLGLLSISGHTGVESIAESCLSAAEIGMDDTEMQDPSTEAEPLPPITLDVFQFVRIAQSQHGLKHYDYARYRSRPSSY